MRGSDEKENKIAEGAGIAGTGKNAGSAEENPGKTSGGETGRKKKYFARTAGAAIILVVVLCMNYVAGLCFDGVHLSDYYRVDVDRLEEEGTDVDMIIVGASQVYHSCNPDIISEEMGIGEVIDCTTASSMFDGQYYMLRDMLRRFHPKYVVLEMGWRRFTSKSEGARNRGKLLMADRMKWADKLEYGMHCFNPEQMLNLLCPMYRYGGKVWGRSQLVQNYKERKAVSEGVWPDESERTYRKNGFCWFEKSADPGSIPAENFSYSNDDVEEYEAYWAGKIVELCREWDVPILWMTVPASLVELYDINNYQASPDYMRDYAEELGCQYLNFNLLKSREEDLPEPLFADRVHLNGEGSIVFSRIFSKIVKMAFEGKDVSRFFYHNIDELKDDVDRVVACNGRIIPSDEEGGPLKVEVKSHQSDHVLPEYRLLLRRKIEPQVQEDGEAGAGEGDEEGSGNDDEAEGPQAQAEDTGDGAAAGDGQAQAEDTGDGAAAGDGQAQEEGSGDGAADGDGQEAGADGEESEPIEELIELRPWQFRKSFTVDPEEIPEGYTLRVEARAKGQTEEFAYVNNLKEKYKAT